MDLASQPAPARRTESAPAPYPGSHFALHLVAQPEHWDQVRAIRYRAHRQAGTIAPAPAERCGDAWDASPGAMTFLLARGGQPIATTRTCASSAARRCDYGALAAYAKEIAAAIPPEATVVEASHAVVDPAVRGDSKTALFHLFKAHMLRCHLEDADWLLIAVGTGEIGFYRRMLDMEMLSGPEPYPGLEAPKVLMGLDFRQGARTIAKRIPALAVGAADLAEFAASGRIPFGIAR